MGYPQALRAAENSGLPFFELETVSAVSVIRVLGPLLGLPGVPAHLTEQVWEM